MLKWSLLQPRLENLHCITVLIIGKSQWNKMAKICFFTKNINLNSSGLVYPDAQFNLLFATTRIHDHSGKWILRFTKIIGSKNLNGVYYYVENLIFRFCFSTLYKFIKKDLSAFCRRKLLIFIFFSEVKDERRFNKEVHFCWERRADSIREQCLSSDHENFRLFAANPLDFAAYEGASFIPLLNFVNPLRHAGYVTLKLSSNLRPTLIESSLPVIYLPGQLSYTPLLINNDRLCKVYNFSICQISITPFAKSIF